MWWQPTGGRLRAARALFRSHVAAICDSVSFSLVVHWSPRWSLASLLLYAILLERYKYFMSKGMHKRYFHDLFNFAVLNCSESNA